MKARAAVVWCSVAGCCLAGLGAATTIAVPTAQQVTSDGETSTNAVLALRPDGNRFRLTFVVEATPSNAVEIALGCDRDEDGDLSSAETEFLVGWRGDRWVAFDTDGEQVAEAVSPGGPTELCWTVRLGDASASPCALSASLDGSAAFVEWKTDPPRMLYNPDWNLAKVFVRGEDPTAGRVSLRRFNQGLSVVLR